MSVFVCVCVQLGLIPSTLLIQLYGCYRICRADRHIWLCRKVLLNH